MFSSDLAWFNIHNTNQWATKLDVNVISTVFNYSIIQRIWQIGITSLKAKKSEMNQRWIHIVCYRTLLLLNMEKLNMLMYFRWICWASSEEWLMVFVFKLATLRFHSLISSPRRMVLLCVQSHPGAVQLHVMCFTTCEVLISIIIKHNLYYVPHKSSSWEGVCLCVCVSFYSCGLVKEV